MKGIYILSYDPWEDKGERDLRLKNKNKCCQHEDENTILRKIGIMNKVETIIKIGIRKRLRDIWLC